MVARDRDSDERSLLTLDNADLRRLRTSARVAFGARLVVLRGRLVDQCLETFHEVGYFLCLLRGNRLGVGGAVGTGDDVEGEAGNEGVEVQARAKAARLPDGSASNNMTFCRGHRSHRETPLPHHQAARTT
jgi:hypothetical protein